VHGIWNCRIVQLGSKFAHSIPHCDRTILDHILPWLFHISQHLWILWAGLAWPVNSENNQMFSPTKNGLKHVYSNGSKPDYAPEL
jgi:hypothetical protein